MDFDFLNYLRLLSGDNLFVTLISLIMLQIFSAIFFLPCSYIPILCGTLLGFELGGAIAVIAQWLATITTFFCGSFIEKINFFKRILNKQNSKFLKKIKLTSKWRDIFIFYINPFVPGSSMGYFFGISKTNFLHFSFKTFLSSFPGCFLPAGFGAGIFEQFVLGNTSHFLKTIIVIFIFFTIFTTI